MPGHPHARWGFHELDSGAARRLVAAAGITPGDLVLDIGAGRGSLTSALVEAGARVVAIELHEGRAEMLRQRFAGMPVKVVRADAGDLRLPHRPYRVVANPPFSVLAAIVKRLTCGRSELSRADIVVPRWAALRFEGRRGGFDCSLGTPPPLRAFRPRPPDAVALLVIERSPGRTAGGRVRSL